MNSFPGKELLIFEEDQALPKYFQELSDFQISVIDGLFQALSHSNYVKQIIESRKILGNLGIDPLPSKDQLKDVVKFSKRNDLAFLWYLFERIFAQEEEFSDGRGKIKMWFLVN